MPDLHMETLGDEEKAALIDQALASLRLSIEDEEGDWQNHPELFDMIERVCDVWDEFADALPGFRA